MSRTLFDLAGLTSADLGRRMRVVHPGWLCVGAGVALSLLGVYAINLAEVGRVEAALSPQATRQAVYLAAGLAAGLMVAAPHYRLIGVLALPAYVLVIGLLIFLLVPAVPSWLVRPRNGTRAWIDLGPMALQPSEFMKVAFVLLTARYLRFRASHRRFFGLVPPGVIACVPVGLITLQPDLGTAILFVPSLLAMLLAAGARIRHLTIVVVAAGLAAPAAYPLLRPHQQARIEALVRQVQGDRSGADDINFQSFTAQTLVGAGQVRGTSPAHAEALVRYNRLPERHNDMIFAVIVARFGLVGGVGVILLYAAWIAGALWTAMMSKDPFGRLTAVGLAGFIFAQMVVNIGMNIGLLPIIGITLPFVSAGGSSMLTVWIMTGLVFNVAMRRPIPPYRPSFEYASDDDDDEPGTARVRWAVRR